MHKTITGLLSFAFILLFTTQNFVYGQVFEGERAVSKLYGADIVRINEETGNIQYVLLNEKMIIQEDQIILYFKKVYALNHPYGFTLLRKEADELGYVHFRYQLTYNKILVLGAVLIAHMQNNRLHSFNGEIYRVSERNSGIPMSESECLRIALDSVHAESYLWEFPEEEAVIKEIKSDPGATWYPSGEWMYIPESLNFNTKEFQLCYKFNIHASVPRTAENIYIDVYNGKLLARENQLHTTDVPGKAITKYSGQKNIITDSTAPFNYRLRENSRGNGVYTLNMRRGTNYGAAVDFLDSNNIWNNINANKDEVATDCHWGAETTWDYYKNKFNRNSYNNNNARINSYVHYANNYDNAFWDGLRMTYGDGNTFKPLTSLDVCGHEITHAVTTYSANLIYSYQSGQLNESFSDIFGNAIERYGKPSSYSWIIGEEITVNGSGLRNMSDPRIKGHPRCYLGTNWYLGAGDNGGVHINSGVQNWWFYLITEGGNGINDFSKAFKVDSLGILSAEKIAYRNLTVYLTPTSQYSDARFYSIQSAKDLFGSCSKEVIAVTNAWYACNVGPEYDSGFVKAAFTADTVVCSTSKTVKFTNLSSNAVSCTWYFGDGSSSNAFNPAYTYSDYGNYTIKLVVTSCFKNLKDSLSKTAYVKVDSTFDICNSVLMPLNGTDSTHKCNSFIYDDGGEDIYKQQRTTYLRISAPGADSIRIKFFDFDYELNYDSLYIYRGKYPGTGVKIGGYTGSNLPNAGNNIVVAGSIVTLRHVSDPFVVGRGFKLFYTAIKKPVKVIAYRDTAICNGNAVLLYAQGSGGYFKDYAYSWRNIGNNDSIVVTPTASTQYYVRLRDVCTGSEDSAEVAVNLLDPLNLQLTGNSTICAGQSINLSAMATGGNSAAYNFNWDNGLGNGSSKVVSPGSNTTYRVVLSDACTPVQDTAYVTVRVKDALKVKINSDDTLVCYNKQGLLSAGGSGGDTLQYNFNWSNGLGNGNMVPFNLSNSTRIYVTLMDACSSLPAIDSIDIEVRAPLKVDLNQDTTLCFGNSLELSALAEGGDDSSYSFSWNPSLSDTSYHKVKPVSATVYTVRLNDQCSDEAIDSIVVNLLDPITVSGLSDTTICNGMLVPLNPVVSGGLTGMYTYTWNPGLNPTPTQLVAPTGSFTYRVIVSDGCTVLGDTAIANITVKNALNVAINSNDTLICHDKTSVLNASGFGGESSQYDFNWSHSLGNGSNKSITLSNSTWISVTLTDACTVSPSVDSIYIVVRPPLSVQLPADTLICFGNNIDLNPVVSGGDNNNYAFVWNQSLPPVQNQLVNPSMQTFYRLMVQDFCSDNAYDSLWVNVLPPLKINGLRDTVICNGASVDFVPLITGGIPLQYTFEWDNGLGNAKNQTVTPLSDIQYKLVVSDNCTAPKDSAIVNISVRTPLQITASLSDYSICSGDSSLLVLDISGGLSPQYQWQLNGSNLMDDSIWVKPVSTEKFITDLYDNCSAPASDTIDLIVNPRPIVDFYTAEQIICNKTKIRFNNNSSGAITYAWFFTPTDSSGMASPEYAYSNSGIYDVLLIAISDSGCVSQLLKPSYIEVIELPKSNFTFLPFQPDYLHRNVNFINQSADHVSFEWDFGDLSKDLLTENPLHTYADTGHYPVSLITRNSLGCTDTMIQLVWVKDVFRVYIPDAISMNGDHINDSLIILGRGIQFYNLKIFSRWGEMIYKGSMGDKPFDGRDANGQPLMKGTYLINLTVRDFEGFMHYVRQVIEIL